MQRLLAFIPKRRLRAGFGARDARAMSTPAFDIVKRMLDKHGRELTRLYDACRERDPSLVAGVIADVLLSSLTGVSGAGMLAGKVVESLFMNEADRLIRAELKAIQAEEALDAFVWKIARAIERVVARLLLQPVALADFVESVREEMECAATAADAIDIARTRSLGRDDDYLYVIAFGHEGDRRLPSGGRISSRFGSWGWAFSMHPKQPLLEGSEWPAAWRRLRPQFMRLVTAIEADLRFVDYEWPRPSSGPDATHPKLGYLSRVDAHDFVLGAGIYLPRAMPPRRDFRQSGDIVRAPTGGDSHVDRTERQSRAISIAA